MSIKGVGNNGSFFAIFNKGDKFCFPVYQPLSEKGSTLKSNNLLPVWSKFLPFIVGPLSDGAQSFMTSVNSHVSVSISLKMIEN